MKILAANELRQWALVYAEFSKNWRYESKKQIKHYHHFYDVNRDTCVIEKNGLFFEEDEV